ncbi:ATP-binding response regulator [Roseimaritima ulvae]|uniref:Sensory transduction protein regX3 n=1 Tax=Roseimaritima ulvae TaxID=980254 RepID=A0A5B9QKL0_9BACT|nr:response regulator [Roseimaritima ulvae]QEG38529.1 Sensory transduction protein regX3 [Roseimaritima ulvae]
MTRILIAEDSPTQATQIRIMLEDAGYEAVTAEDGLKALEAIEQQTCDLVLTDLHMPNMNGLQLVEELRRRYESIPVILITHDGTETIAAEALQKGAASYIPKRYMQSTLLSTIRLIVEQLEAQKSRQQILNTLVESRSKFVLGNNQDLVPTLVQHLETELRTFDYGDETGLFQVSMGLTEAVLNAMDHGNLELSSELRADHDAYMELRKQRCETPPYRDRRVTLTMELTPDTIKMIVADEGPGFDPAIIPDPTDPENLMRENGRGLMLIFSFMDEVRHNESGNEITMIKRRDNGQAEG